MQEDIRMGRKLVPRGTSKGGRSVSGEAPKGINKAMTSISVSLLTLLFPCDVMRYPIVGWVCNQGSTCGLPSSPRRQDRRSARAPSSGLNFHAGVELLEPLGAADNRRVFLELLHMRISDSSRTTGIPSALRGDGVSSS